MREITYGEALREALREEMQRDPRVYIFGEDVGVYGGAFGVTRGLLEEFGPERVRDTPISEAAIVGLSVGAAMTGMRPVAELMYVDFATIAMDQIVNQAAKIRFMFGGKTQVPLVVRAQGGGGKSTGAQHAQSLEAWFAHVPGLKVVMPATPADAKGLLKAAIRDLDPVIFLEHKLLYGQKGPVPDGEHLVELGRAAVARPGRDVSILTYSRGVYLALGAAERLAAEGISAEVVDLRTIKPLDRETILDSARRTGRVVTVHEAHLTGGVGAEISALIAGSDVFWYLEAPIVRVAARDVPMPFSPVLEEAVLPGEDDIIAAVRQTLGQ